MHLQFLSRCPAILLLLVLFAGPVGAAVPATLVGKVLHLQPYVYRGTADHVYRFDATHYTKIMAIGGFVTTSPVPMTNVDLLEFNEPKNTGTYRYTVLSETFATLDLGGWKIEFGKPNNAYQANSFFENGSTLGYGYFVRDYDSYTSAPVANVALRGRVAPGQPLIAGFITRERQNVLIRIVGPSLRQFGVTVPWEAPQFSLRGVPHIGSWVYRVGASQDRFNRLFGYVGAFPLVTWASDCVRIVTLGPGQHTLQCSTQGNDPGGETLIEIYRLP